MIVSACSLFKGATSLSPEPVLLAPTPTMTPVVLKQSLTLQSPAQSNSFIAILRLTHEKTSLVALTLAGQPFLSQSFDGTNWTSENVSGQTLPEQEIFSMMQFTLWPTEELQKRYQETDGWTLTFTDSTRAAYFFGEPYFTVSTLGDETLIKHEMGHYRVNIRTFEEEPLRR